MKENTGFIIGLCVSVILILVLLATAANAIFSIAVGFEKPSPIENVGQIFQSDPLFSRLDSLMFPQESQDTQIDSLSNNE